MRYSKCCAANMIAICTSLLIYLKSSLHCFFVLCNASSVWQVLRVSLLTVGVISPCTVLYAVYLDWSVMYCMCVPNTKCIVMYIIVCGRHYEKCENIGD